MNTNALLERLRGHKILADWQVRELKPIGQLRVLGRQLLERNWLTPFQVNQALAGRWDQLVVGSYILLERLGQGGMGQVFKARHPQLGRLAAVKLLRQERRQDPSTVERFRREVQAMAQLSHPNIVAAFDADEINGFVYLAMEYVDGTTLGRLVREQGPLSLSEACACIQQAALGLGHAFERGMVHRDIKPSNLLVTQPRRDGSRLLKILDLGLARWDEPADDDATLTMPGMVLGTPDYIAPEQAVNPRQADIRADLYSLGCTFYYLLTGSVPFPGGSALEKLICHRTVDARPVTEFRPNMPAPLVKLIRRLMAKDPAQRPATPAELVAELDVWLGSTSNTITDHGAITHVNSIHFAEQAPTITLTTLDEPPRRQPWRMLTAGLKMVQRACGIRP